MPQGSVSLSSQTDGNKRIPSLDLTINSWISMIFRFLFSNCNSKRESNRPPCKNPMNDQLFPKQGCSSQRDSSQEISAVEGGKAWIWSSRAVDSQPELTLLISWLIMKLVMKQLQFIQTKGGFIDSWIQEVQLQVLFQKRIDSEHSRVSAPSLWVA